MTAPRFVRSLACPLLALALSAPLLGQPRFAYRDEWSNLAGASSPIAVDLDGDGRREVLVLSAGKIRVFAQQGDATLVETTSFWFGPGGSKTDIRLFVPIDRNNDGALDMIIAVRDELSIYINNTKTSRGRSIGFSLVRGPFISSARVITTGDYDGDGDQDYAITADGRLHVLVNSGAPSFSFSVRMFDSGSSLLASGDVDGNGADDIVTGWPNRVYLRPTTNRSWKPGGDWGSLKPPVSSFVLADFDGDRDLDILAAADKQFPLWCLLNDGSANFKLKTTGLPKTSYWVSDIDVTDVDRDGDLDAIICRIFGPPVLFVNDGRASFIDVSLSAFPPCRELAVLDLDGFGGPDLALLPRSTSAAPVLAISTGPRSFAPIPSIPPRIPAFKRRSGVAGLALADVNGDGAPDYLRFTTANGVPHQLFLNDGHGYFSAAAPGSMPATSASTQAATLVDVDRDGDLDLVQACLGRNALFLNNGRGVFSDESKTRLPKIYAPSLAVASGDVDGDGDPDLVFGNLRQRNRLYLNDSRGVYTEATVGRLPLDGDDTRALLLLDVDGDRDLDLVCGNAGDGRLYLNNGRGVFAYDPSAPRVAFRGVVALASGDWDRDGDVDLLSVGAGKGGVQAQLNDGRGRFRLATWALQDSVNPAGGIAVGDFDGDGDLDIVLPGRSSQSGPGGPRRLYVNDGRGRFTDLSRTLPKWALTVDSVDVVAGDIDGDGDDDLIFANEPTTAVPQVSGDWVFTNLHRHQRFLPVPSARAPSVPLVLQVWARPGYSPTPQLVFPMLGLPLSRPVRFPGMGTLWLDPATILFLPPTRLATPGGSAQSILSVPAGTPSKTKIYAQAFIFHDAKSWSWGLSPRSSTTTR